MVKGELVRSNGRLHIVEPVRRERESRIPLDTANKNQPLIEQVFELVRTRGPATVRRLGSCTTLGDSALASALDDLVGAGRIRTDKVARHLRYYVDGEVDWTLRAKREVVQVLSAASTGATSRDIARSANWDFARIAKTLESLVAHGAVKKFRRKTPTGKTLAHYRLGKSATLADINVDNDGSNSPLDEG